MVTLVAYMVMAALFLSEAWRFAAVDIAEQLTLDRGVGAEVVHISIEVDFLALPCDEVRVLLRAQSARKKIDDVTPSFQRTPLPLAGCKVTGAVDAPKVAGILEVSPTDPVAFNAGLQSVSFEALKRFNASHEIRALAFGAELPGLKSPLAGQRSAHSDGMYQYQYQAKVVPTSLTRLDGSSIASNQYSSTFYTKKAIDEDDNPFARFGLLQHVEEPGFFLRFDFSPIVVSKREVKRSLAQFLTSVCAIVGGTYAVAELTDALLHRAIIAKKLD